MILDKLTNAKRYFSLHPDFPAAFKWLSEATFEAYPVGRTDIMGNRVYVNMIREDGRGQAAARFEAHRRYIDIQYTVTGADIMGWTNIRPDLRSLGYDAAKDLEFFSDRPNQWIPVASGHFTVFFPEDVHAPMSGTGAMVKAVLKVAV